MIDAKIEALRAWEAGDAKRQRRTYWALYTITFVLMTLLALNVYILNGLSIVWSVDGMEQFYPYFVYEGTWLREIFSNLASGNFEIPMWSFDLGYGSDLLAEMDVFYDPLNFFSVFFSEENSEWAFQALIIIRWFLAGVAFSLFSLHFKNERWCTLLAAMAYCLGGTALTALHWPGSTWPLILFPLLLLGVEKILDGKSPVPFILTTFLFFLISWYFAYMATIFLVIYCAVRVWRKLKTERELRYSKEMSGDSIEWICYDDAKEIAEAEKRLFISQFWHWTWRIALFFIIGIVLAGFALWPMVLDLTVNERATNATTSIPVLYSFTYYMDTLTSLVGTAAVGSDCFIGYGAFAFLACILLLARKGKDALLKAALIAMFIILCIPALGSALNGFNYATNRWVWALALLVCFILAREIPKLLEKLDWKLVRILVICCGVFVLAVFALPWMRNEKTVAGCVALLAALGICIQQYAGERTKRTLLAGVLLFSIILNAYYFTCPEIFGTARETSTLGTLYSKITNSSADYAVVEAAKTDGTENDDSWRYDADPVCGDRPRNNSLVLGISGINFYNSLYNGKVDKFHTELGLTQGGINFSYQNLMGSTMVEAISGVKYYVIPEGKASSPYGYDVLPIETTLCGEQRYEVYKNKNALGKAFTYDACISRSDYDALTPLERQQALLQGVVVEDDKISETGVEQITPTSTSVEVDYADSETITEQNAGTIQKNVYITDNSIYVLKENSSVTLTFEGKENCETYVNFKNFKLNPLTPFDTQNVKAMLTGNEPTLADDVSNLKWTMKWVSPTTVKIGINSLSQSTNRTISAPTPSNHLYGGKDDWSVDLGYSEDALTEITLTFDKVGEYSFDDLSIVCQEMDSVSENIEKRQAVPVTNYVESTNTISAHVDADTTQMVYFSTPKTPGWTATVDGEEVEIIDANTAFMAVKVGAGSHDIQLHFTSPGVKEGLITSAVGLLMFAGVVLLTHVKKRKTTKEQR